MNELGKFTGCVIIGMISFSLVWALLYGAFCFCQWKFLEPDWITYRFTVIIGMAVGVFMYTDELKKRQEDVIQQSIRRMNGRY